MPFRKQLAYFLIGFFSVWTLALLIYFIVFPTVSEEGIENPLPTVPGKIIWNYDNYGNIGNEENIICARNPDEARNHLGKLFSLPAYSSNRYFDEDIKTASVEAKPEYVQLTLRRKINDTDIWNVLRCDYFTYRAKLPPFADSNNRLLGIFHQARTKENLDYLIWFLMNINFIQTSGFNQGINILSTKLDETDDAVTRTDRALYSVFNDTPPFFTTKSKITIMYSLDKKNGSLHVTRKKGHE